tara:strand:- start:596 stop:1060 length:465 start_codon:yes stop_codon:yes gene_type:complete
MAKFERFKQGLKDFNLTYEQIMKSGWNYCGGNFDSHKNYYKLRFGEEEELLPHESECVCGKKGLVNNGYICNKKETDFLVLGSCCIKQFIGGRTCEVCGEGHRRHKTNICKSCETFKKYNGNYGMSCEGCKKRIKLSTWRKKCGICFHADKLTS